MQKKAQGWGKAFSNIPGPSWTSQRVRNGCFTDLYRVSIHQCLRGFHWHPDWKVLVCKPCANTMGQNDAYFSASFDDALEPWCMVLDFQSGFVSQIIQIPCPYWFYWTFLTQILKPTKFFPGSFQIFRDFFLRCIHSLLDSIICSPCFLLRHLNLGCFSEA